MNWLQAQLKVWPLWAVILIVIIGFGVFINTAARADETVVTKGTTEKGYVRLKSTTSSGVTKTTGTINGQYVRTKTRNGVTTGTIDGKSIRIKSKVTTDTFKPDWNPDW